MFKRISKDTDTYMLASNVQSRKTIIDNVKVPIKTWRAYLEFLKNLKEKIDKKKGELFTSKVDEEVREYQKLAHARLKQTNNPKQSIPGD